MELDQLRFAKTHEWISLDGKVGISDHAQKEITDVVFIELPSLGKRVEKGEEVGTIESVKAAFPIYSPASGKIVAVNSELTQDPALINQSPYEKGWFFKLEIADPNELSHLFNPEAYDEFLKSETPVH